MILKVLKWYSIIYLILLLIYTIKEMQKEKDIRILYLVIFTLLPIIIYLILS